MSLNGQYWNPQYAGEGFYLTEEDGRLIGAYFTYDFGKQSWYVFDCERNGNVLTGKITQPEGGDLASMSNPVDVTQPIVGDIIFTDTQAGLDFEASIYGNEAIGYELEPLFGVHETSDNPFEGKLTFEVKGFGESTFKPGSFQQDTNGQWYLMWSTAQIWWTSLSSGVNTMLEIKIEASENIGGVSEAASGYGDPHIIGTPHTFFAGDTSILSFRLNKEARPSGHANANYQIDTDLGPLILYTARILQGS